MAELAAFNLFAESLKNWKWAGRSLAKNRLASARSFQACRDSAFDYSFLFQKLQHRGLNLGDIRRLRWRWKKAKCRDSLGTMVARYQVPKTGYSSGPVPGTLCPVVTGYRLQQGAHCAISILRILPSLSPFGKNLSATVDRVSCPSSLCALRCEFICTRIRT